MFNVPIPGQSLTAEPKNAPYERPPQFVRPEDSLIFMMEKLQEPNRVDGILLMVEDGMTIEQVTRGLLRVAVSGGRFTIDVATLIAPVIHEYIYQTCKKNKVPCKHGWEEDPKKIVEAGYLLHKARAKKVIENLRFDGSSLITPREEEIVETEVEELPAETTPSQGLMARRGEV